ncbi:MAG TPA: flagellar basal body L-ring protein FlgH [Candidatus Sulfotelmatobacter sp.]|nr:flagellar basal body L-ring protein FlgH [Candidatus Sulfotelmatobacter sp.]
MRTILEPIGVLLTTALFLFPASAWPHPKKEKAPATSTVYDEYLARVRAMNPASPVTVGSLWVDSGPLAMLAADYKARRPGDLITIHLADNFTAATAGENNQSRQFAAQSAVTALFGPLAANNKMQNLLNANSSNSLDGKGQSTMSSNVSLNLAAQVMETLPNGVLVIQAARDITLGNDRQTVYLRGLVRPGDLASDNSIASALISDLQVEIKGKGAVADASRQSNIIVRTLLHFLSF